MWGMSPWFADCVHGPYVADRQRGEDIADLGGNDASRGTLALQRFFHVRQEVTSQELLRP